MTTSDSSPSDKRRLAVHVALGVIGMAGTVWLARAVGVNRLVDAARGAAPWLLIAVVLEGGRIALDGLATQWLLGGRAPWKPLVVAHLAAYPIILLFPAGRAAGEAVKAGLLGRYVGLDRAAAAAIFNQALPLVASFMLSLPCGLVVAWRLGAHHPLTIAVFVQALTAIGLGVVILVAARRRTVGALLRKISSRMGVAVERVQDRVRELGRLPLGPLALMLGNRGLRGAQIVVLTLGVTSAAWPEAVTMWGAHLVGAAVGDLIPAQFGATDGALALASDALALPLSQGVAIALILHGAQIGWALVGGLFALVSRQSPTLPHSASQAASEHSSKSKISAPGKPH